VIHGCLAVKGQNGLLILQQIIIYIPFDEKDILGGIGYRLGPVANHLGHGILAS
jgi:hypothetical protein